MSSVDNSSSLAGMQKGYSARPDTALLIMAFWIHATDKAARPLFERVPSALNISDLASRNKCDVLLSVLPRCSEVALVLPPAWMWRQQFTAWPKAMRGGARPSKASRLARKRAQGT